MVSSISINKFLLCVSLKLWFVHSFTIINNGPIISSSSSPSSSSKYVPFSHNVITIEGFTKSQLKMSEEDEGYESTTLEAETDDGDDDDTTNNNMLIVETKKQEQEKLKKQLLQLGASYDRGFSATPRAREQVENVMNELELLNDINEPNPSKGIDGSDIDDELCPLQGNWRLIWTTAQDVLGLAINPIVTIGAIYQIFEPPIVTNVIDLLPRFQQALIPSSFPISTSSILRANVQTRASSRGIDLPMRIGLNFESVKLEPKEFLGQDVSTILPPIGFDIPQLVSIPDSIGNDIGYFDITYFDNDVLIIRQNAPGGMIALVRVDNADP